MPSRTAVSLSAAVTLASLVAGFGTAAHAAGARTVNVTSYDGTKIVTNFFPAAELPAGRTAPTVLLGPGWGQRGETDPAGGQTGPLRAAGYNVVTWNPRGFGSGGAANVDDPRVEGRDMRVLIDWIARQPEVRLDRAGDPRLGMAGGSYGGAIQLVTAGLDKRVDVIVPAIAFSDLLRSLYGDQVNRSGWGRVLCAAGLTGGNKVAPQVLEGCVTGLASGHPSPRVLKWYVGHGPDYLIKKIKIPTLILQGTVDTLFTLREGIQTYRTVQANRAPVKMIWFCGGHGACLTKPGPADHTIKATVAWFDRYLKMDRTVGTGPGFEYVAQDGVYYGASAYPLPAAAPVKATGSGSLTFSPQDAEPFINDKPTSPNSPFPPSGIIAKAAAKAVNVPIPAPKNSTQVVGVPRVTLKYQGLAHPAKSAFFAQIVDRKTGLVVGNQATPLPVTLDGKARTVTRDIEAVAWNLDPASDLVLQIIPISGLFDYQRSTGLAKLTASISLPQVRTVPAGQR